METNGPATRVLTHVETSQAPGLARSVTNQLVDSGLAAESEGPDAGVLDFSGVDVPG